MRFGEYRVTGLFTGALIGPSVSEHPGDRSDGIPVARGDRYSKEPI